VLVVGPIELQSLLEKVVKDNVSEGGRPVPQPKPTLLTKAMTATTTVRLNLEQIQLVSEVELANVRGIGLQCA
jgi:hypothetical protein